MNVKLKLQDMQKQIQWLGRSLLGVKIYAVFEMCGSFG